MSGRDFLLVASTAAITSFLAYFAGAYVTTPPEDLRCESGAAFGEHAAHAARRDGAAIPANTGKPRLHTGDALQQDSSQPAKASHSGGTAIDPAFAFRKQQELGERFSSFFKDGSNPDPGAINSTIESRYYLEEWNQQWAGDRERNIRTLFDHEDLSGITPLQVTCRSKNCQVVLPLSSQDQVRRLSEKFMQAATNGDVGMKNQVISYFPDTSTGRLVFYLSEGGNTDLFQ